MTSIHEALDRLWTATDDTPMMEWCGDWVTWGTVRAQADEIDALLTAAGCSENARVAVVLGNRPESVAALLAIMRGRRTLVTVSPLQPPARLGTDVKASGVNFVLAPDALFGEYALLDAVTALGATAWSVDDEAIVERVSGSRTPDAPSPDSDVAIEMLTSGTTGAPKRIPLTRTQLGASLDAASGHAGGSAADERPALSGQAALVTIPIVHIGGLWSLLQALVQARPFVMLERFTVPGWQKAVRDHRPVVAGLPPAAIRSVLESGVPPEDLSSLKAVNAGTSPVDPDLVDAFYEKYSIPILIVYGATEFSGAVAGWSARAFRASWTDKRGSVGQAFPGVRLKVVDDDLVEVAPGITGRLQVSSLQAGGTENSYVTTSDLAHLDDDGFLYIDGRADDVILRGGFKIQPDVVVRALRSHEHVLEAAVAGLPDERLGSVPVAAVEIRAGATDCDGAELRAWCRQHLTPYEVPVQVFVVDELPRGAALKVDRRRLVEMLESLRAEPDSFTPDVRSTSSVPVS